MNQREMQAGLPLQKPKLLALLICERALLDEDKVTTLIRIIDVFTAKIPKPVTELLKSGTGAIELECWVYTRWGLGKGTFTEELAIRQPDLTELPQRAKSIFTLDNPSKLHQVRHRVRLPVTKSGDYAFVVYLDGEYVAEHRFSVNFEVVTGVEQP